MLAPPSEMYVITKLILLSSLKKTPGSNEKNDFVSPDSNEQKKKHTIKMSCLGHIYPNSTLKTPNNKTFYIFCLKLFSFNCEKLIKNVQGYQQRMRLYNDDLKLFR